MSEDHPARTRRLRLRALLRRITVRVARTAMRMYHRIRRVPPALHYTPLPVHLELTGLVEHGTPVVVDHVQLAVVTAGFGGQRTVSECANATEAFGAWFTREYHPGAPAPHVSDLLHRHTPSLFTFATPLSTTATLLDVVLRITYLHAGQQHVLSYSLHGNDHLRFPLYEHAARPPAHVYAEDLDTHAALRAGPHRDFYAHNTVGYHVYVGDIYGPRLRREVPESTFVITDARTGRAVRMHVDTTQTGTSLTRLVAPA